MDERETWSALQSWFIEEVCEPVYEAWLKMAFLTLGLPGADWRVYNCPVWHPKKFAWIDPLKDAQAEVLAINNGLTTRTRVLNALGYDFDETMRELAEEQQLIEELGLKIGTDTKGVADAPIETPVDGAASSKTQAPRLLTGFSKRL
jgi:capsid protein